MPDESTGTAEAPEQGTEATPESNGGPPPVTQESIERVASRVSDLGSSLDTRFNELAARIPEREPEPEQDDVTAYLKELGYELPDEEAEEPDDVTLSLQEIGGLVSKLSAKEVEKRLSEQLHPVLAEQREGAIEQAFRDLEERYPKLVEDDDWNKKVGEGAHERADQISSSMVRGEQAARLSEALLDNPHFIELVHKSLVADEHAQQETPVEAEPEGLERPRGANPGSPEPDDATDRMIQAVGHSELAKHGIV